MFEIINPSKAQAQTRRDFLRLSAAGAIGVGLSGWLNVLAAHAQENARPGRRPHKSCILLWMDGGMSHKDTFDLKPGTRNGGEFREIETNVPGIRISEHLPRLARKMNEGVLIRNMSTGEGAHARARYYLHTGYREGVGGLSYPSLGSIVSAELGQEDFPMPNYVSIGRSYGAGFLGPRHQPLIVNDPSRGVEDTRPLVSEARFNSRIGLLEEMEVGFLRQQTVAAAQAHSTTYQRAVAMLRSRQMQAFDLSREPEASRNAYGSSRFAQSCLLARRLVEVGVPFVEASLGGWDTHTDNFNRVRTLSGTIDTPIAQLITDLRERGLLDSTLVILMGEFGRTPTINNRGAQPGRDHYPRAWSLAMWGGGIRAGQVIGATDAEGASVRGQPTSALNFMATVCRILGIDYTKENNTPIGRPIRIVDRGGEPIREIFG